MIATRCVCTSATLGRVHEDRKFLASPLHGNGPRTGRVRRSRTTRARALQTGYMTGPSTSVVSMHPARCVVRCRDRDFSRRAETDLGGEQSASIDQENAKECGHDSARCSTPPPSTTRSCRMPLEAVPLSDRPKKVDDHNDGNVESRSAQSKVARRLQTREHTRAQPREPPAQHHAARQRRRHRHQPGGPLRARPVGGHKGCATPVYESDSARARRVSRPRAPPRPPSRPSGSRFGRGVGDTSAAGAASPDRRGRHTRADRVGDRGGRLGRAHASTRAREASVC